MDRRQVIQIATGAMSLVAFQANAAEKAGAASAAVAGRTPEDVARDEDYWTEIRNAFTIDRNVINFNNGYASPAPIPVQDAMRRYLAYSDMGPIQTMVNVLYPQIERVRENLAKVAGCDPEEMAITRNASEANEIVQYGIDLKPGDEVLTTDQDYPRMLMTFRQRERRDGIKLVTVSFPVPVMSSGRSLNRIEKRGDAQDQADPDLPHHQPHRRDLPGAPHRRHGPCQGHSLDGGRRPRLQPFPVQDLGPQLRLLRRLSAQMDLRAHRHGVPLCAEVAYRPDLVLDGVERQAGERYPQVRGGRHPSRRQSQRDQRGLGVQREYRHRAEGGAAALSARPLGAPAAGQCQVQILHSESPELSCGIGFIGFKGVDAGKMYETLYTKHNIVTARVEMPGQYDGLRVTPHIYSTLRDVDTFAETVEKELLTA